MMKKLAEFAWRNAGHCMRCMVSSLQTFGLAAAFAAVGFAVHFPFWIVSGLCIVAAALGLLWLTHVVAFSIKMTRRTRSGGVSSLEGRRKVLVLIGKSLAIAVAPAVLAISPKAAWAVSSTDHNCYCCADNSPENCGCDTPASCIDYGKCTMGGNC
jgi:hypothetical protein